MHQSVIKVLHIDKDNPRLDYKINAGQVVSGVEKCSQEKDLGVTFDECLNFDVHIQNVINKANQRDGIIKRT